MMFIICNKDSVKAAKYLIENTNKKFCLAQLRELCQLICSAGISEVYKKKPQAKEIQAWIKEYPIWTFMFLRVLLSWCKENCKITEDFLGIATKVLEDIKEYSSGKALKSPAKAVFRYKKEYRTETIFSTNDLICIENAVEEYKKYLIWKGSR